MTLTEYLKEHGGISELRAAIGVKNDEQIRQWARGWQNRKPSPRYCVAIERATGGLVTRQELRPHDWRDVWPELAKPPAQGVADVTLGDTSAFGEPQTQQEQPDKLLALARAALGKGDAGEMGLSPGARYLYESACACANKRGYVPMDDVACLPNTPEAQQELEQRGLVKEDRRGGWRLPKLSEVVP